MFPILNDGYCHGNDCGFENKASLIISSISSVLGQTGKTQNFFSLRGGQSMPPRFGRFITRFRRFCTALSPQVCEQGVHSPHSDRTQSTGHLFGLLHFFFLDSRREHLPPFRASLSTVLVFIMNPLPHVTEHGDQSVQEDT